MCWVLDYLLCACLLVVCLFTCWVLVFVLRACLGVGCMFTCPVLVYFFGAGYLLAACLPVGEKYDVYAVLSKRGTLWASAGIYIFCYTNKGT